MCPKTSPTGRPRNGFPTGRPDKVVDSIRNADISINNLSQTQYGPNIKKYDASIFDIMDWFNTMTTNEYIRAVKTKNWVWINFVLNDINNQYYSL